MSDPSNPPTPPTAPGWWAEAPRTAPQATATAPPTDPFGYGTPAAAAAAAAPQPPYAGPWTAWAPAGAPPVPPPMPMTTPMPPRRSAVGVVALVLVAGLGGGVLGGLVGANRADRASTAIVRQVLVPNAPIARPKNVPEILAKVEPGVVSIHTNLGAGTGMILTPTGEVLTNNHVIQGATNVTVTLFNETTGRKATIRGFDRANDVALLQITGASGLPTVQLGDSDKLVVGDSVIAVGNALDLAGGPTVTEGIVSAKGRSVDPTAPQNLIQTDAAINPGNSGGPLVNSAGEVIGMDTLVINQANPQQSAQSLGFAIPVNHIKPMLTDLANGVRRVPAYLGVGVVSLTPALAQRYGNTATHGVIIQDLPVGGPAANAGLQTFDVVTGFDGHQINTESELINAIHAHKPGDQVTVDYVRGSKSGSVTVTLGTASASAG